MKRKKQKRSIATAVANSQKNRIPPGVKSITEKDGIHKGWYEQAKKQTLESLPAFLAGLANDYGHDYGTICHAVASAALGAAWAMEHSSQGGITGFQASCVLWEFIKYWGMDTDGPMALMRYRHMLYPQYESRFTTISKECWEDLIKEARKNLAEGENAHPDVKKHWKNILAGKIPFGYKLRD